jgi:hypothetical protein
MLEAALLLCFGLVGSHLALRDTLFVPATVVLLCFIMGLQNAIITKLSGAEIRTTHMTGIVTDIGIELGKLFYWNASNDDPASKPVITNRERLKVHSGMLASFFAGGMTGALGFKHVGYASTIPLAAVLTALAIIPLLDDLRERPWRPARKPQCPRRRTDRERSRESGVQSCMLAQEPYALALGSTRTMMGFLLSQPNPRAFRSSAWAGVRWQSIATAMCRTPLPRLSKSIPKCSRRVRSSRYLATTSGSR